jgi:hypothetical protein
VTANAARQPASQNPPPPAERLQARFWQSPFALCAATIVTAQFMILSTATVDARAIPYDILSSLTLIAIGMLAAGILPQWNYLALGHDRLIQQAGLVSTEIDWTRIKSIESDPLGVKVRFVEIEDGGNAVVRVARLFNRYGLGPADFQRMIEAGWRRAGLNF